MQVGDIITDTHSGSTFRFRISSINDGGKNGARVIRRYTGQFVMPDGSVSAQHYQLNWLNHFV